MHCYGLCSVTPVFMLNHLLTESKITSHKDVYIVSKGRRLKKRPKKNILFFLNMSDFTSNLRTLNTANYAETDVYVFSSVLSFKAFSGITLLDVKNKKTLGFHYLSTVKNVVNKTEKVDKKTFNYTSDLIKIIREGSLLTPLMTFIYTLSANSLQTPVKIVSAIVLYKNLPTDSIKELLIKKFDVKLTDKSYSKLALILNSKIANNYRKAFITYRKMLKTVKDPVIEVAKKFKLSDYEIRYLLSVVNSNKKLVL